MERQTMKRYIETYMTEMELAVRHPILKRDVGSVNLDKVKVFFLLLPKLNGEQWTDSINTAAMAVGAVHAGFDAHDTIDALDATSTIQQLTVLSGDYFSAIHYKLLASIPDFDFIRSLSHAIGQVHETKASYQDGSLVGSEQLLDALRIVEAGCIIQFLHSFGFSRYIPLVAAALPLLALDKEIGATVQKKGLDALDCTIQDDDAEDVISTLRVIFQTAIDEADFITPFLQQEVLDMAVQFLGKPI